MLFGFHVYVWFLIVQGIFQSSSGTCPCSSALSREVTCLLGSQYAILCFFALVLVEAQCAGRIHFAVHKGFSHSGSCFGLVCAVLFASWLRIPFLLGACVCRSRTIQTYRSRTLDRDLNSGLRSHFIYHTLCYHQAWPFFFSQNTLRASAWTRFHARVLLGARFACLFAAYECLHVASAHVLTAGSVAARVVGAFALVFAYQHAEDSALDRLDAFSRARPLGATFACLFAAYECLHVVFSHVLNAGSVAARVFGAFALVFAYPHACFSYLSRRNAACLSFMSHMYGLRSCITRGIPDGIEAAHVRGAIALAKILQDRRACVGLLEDSFV